MLPNIRGDGRMSERAYCYECNNTGFVHCECGGDICVCQEYGNTGGERPCPSCYPGHYVDRDDDE